MGNELMKFKAEEINGELVIDSREVAKMMGKEHKALLKDIEGSKDEKSIGIIPTLIGANFEPINYFVESTYTDSKNRSYKCYLITKKGCEMLGNKQQGAKGILFTARYVERFNEMENKIKSNQLEIANNKIERLESIIDKMEEKANKFEILTLEATKMYKPSHKRKLQYDRLIKSVTSTKEEYDIVKEWIYAILRIDKWEDTSIEQHDKILEIISTTSRMLNIKRFEQLSLI
ncbi:MAG: Rha family transcriptional regulator [Clostridium sp.]|nr:Rha family transcriptional regulator [Clostridium sp.]